MSFRAHVSPPLTRGFLGAKSPRATGGFGGAQAPLSGNDIIVTMF